MYSKTKQDHLHIYRKCREGARCTGRPQLVKILSKDNFNKNVNGYTPTCAGKVRAATTHSLLLANSSHLLDRLFAFSRHTRACPPKGCP